MVACLSDHPMLAKACRAATIASAFTKVVKEQTQNRKPHITQNMFCIYIIYTVKVCEKMRDSEKIWHLNLFPKDFMIQGLDAVEAQVHPKLFQTM